MGHWQGQRGFWETVRDEGKAERGEKGDRLRRQEGRNGLGLKER